MEFALDRFSKRTLGTLLDAVAANYVDRETFAFDEQRRSYSTLKNNTAYIAKGLVVIAVEPGERVSLWMTRRLEWLDLMCPISSFKTHP